MAYDISLVIPCLNERETVTGCVAEAMQAFNALGLNAEIIVVDNGSTDGSASAAQAAGATVIHQPLRGYGHAIRTGLAAAGGKYILTGDADGSHTFSSEILRRYIRPLHDGADCVVGNRFGGRVENNSMPRLNVTGIHFLSAIFSQLYHVKLHDITCGMRGYTKSHLASLAPKAPGMEFAIEILVLSAQAGAAIVEVPIDMRARLAGKSHLRPWRDGYTHLMMLLAHRAKRSSRLKA